MRRTSPRSFPQGAALIEFGSGASIKTRIVLGAAKKLAAYVPVDISAEFLEQPGGGAAHASIPASPCFRSRPISASRSSCRSRSKACRASASSPARRSAISSRTRRAAFLRQAGETLGPGAVFIVGVDLVKDQRVLQKAYNDKQGVTAKFNLNLLTRINRELGANFDVAAFEHHAFYNREKSRIEMHLASMKRQKVRLCGETHRVPRRRDHPHREQLQVFGGVVRRDGARLGLDASRRCGPTATSASRFTRCARAELALRFLLDLAPQPARGLLRRRGLPSAGWRAVGLAHHADVDRVDQRPQRGDQRRIVGAPGRDQQDRVVGRDGAAAGSSSTARSCSAMRPSLV